MSCLKQCNQDRLASPKIKRQSRHAAACQRPAQLQVGVKGTKRWPVDFCSRQGLYVGVVKHV